MKRFKDLPLGILIEIQNSNPFMMEWMTLNEISGGLLWKGGLNGS